MTAHKNLTYRENGVTFNRYIEHYGRDENVVENYRRYYRDEVDHSLYPTFVHWVIQFRLDGGSLD